MQEKVMYMSLRDGVSGGRCYGLLGKLRNLDSLNHKLIGQTIGLSAETRILCGRRRQQSLPIH